MFRRFSTRLIAIVVIVSFLSISLFVTSTATAKPDKYDVETFVPGGNGKLSPGLQSVKSGGNAKISVQADKGYHLVSLTDNGNAVIPLPDKSYSITNVTADHHIGAVFAKDGVRDTITTAIYGDPEGFFRLISDFAPTADASTYVYAQPIGVDPRGQAYADLCLTVPSFENGDLVRNTDGTVISTVRFRQNLKWSDGCPLNVDDYIFAHALYVSDAVNIIYRAPMDLVTNIQRIDDYTCRVTWSHWSPYIPIGWNIFPEHVLGPIFRADPVAITTCDYIQHPIHAGPYVLESWVSGESLTFVANPFYWQPGKPLLHRVVVRLTPDTNAMGGLLSSGILDVCSPLLTIADAEQFEANMGTSYNVYYNEGTAAGIMEWNLASPWFSNRLVRQALYYGINRDLIARQSGVGLDAVESPIVSPTVYSRPVLDRYTYDPTRANQLLDDAEWTWNVEGTQRFLPDGTPAVLAVSYSWGSFRGLEVSLLTPMLAVLGITVEPDPLLYDDMLTAEITGTFVAILHGIVFDHYDAYASVLGFRSNQIPTAANGWHGLNVTRYTSSEMDTWLDVAERALDSATLVDAYDHIQDVFAEDLPCLYLEQHIYPDAVRKGLLGYDHFFFSTTNFNWNIQDWSWQS